MKFSQIQLGNRFQFQGKTYRKVSPLMAQPEDGEKQRLIARSAVVDLVDGQATTPATQTPSQIAVQDIDQAMQTLAERINDAVAESGLDAQQTNQLLRRMQVAFLQCRQQLKLP